MKKIVAIVIMAVMAACSFEPIYREVQQHTAPANILRQIEIITPKTREGDLLKARLEDHLYAGGVREGTRYRLYIQLENQSQPLTIEPDGIASRLMVNYASPYELKRGVDNVRLKQGVLRRQVAYNVSPTDDYATYVSQEDASRQAIEELAEDYKFRITALFAKQPAD